MMEHAWHRQVIIDSDQTPHLSTSLKANLLDDRSRRSWQIEMAQGPQTYHTVTRANLRTTTAAAIAGIVFSILLIVVLWLLRISVPDDPQELGSWLNSKSG